ncbi:TPA: hypothetical protein U2C71_000395 [Streptococcus suis]|nr:hypothetical protein [Streptococcus suis]
MAIVAINKIGTQNILGPFLNDSALPTYTAEAISNQSAQVNQISGATEAYKGFTGSLQDAINQAS